MVDQNYTHLAIIADRSGSMRSIADDMNEGLKTFLEDQAKVEGTLRVDVVTFDSTVEIVAANSKVEDITHPIIKPRGTTALNDAIGFTIDRLGDFFRKLDEIERPGKVIILVVTDGMENASKEFKNSDIKKMVTEQQDTWKWDFVFLGANIDSFSVGGGYGFVQGSTLNYTASTAGVSSVLRSATAYVTTSRNLGAAAFDADGNVVNTIEPNQVQ